jgi:hypothetical protein
MQNHSCGSHSGYCVTAAQLLCVDVRADKTNAAPRFATRQTTHFYHFSAMFIEQAAAAVTPVIYIPEATAWIWNKLPHILTGGFHWFHSESRVPFSTGQSTIIKTSRDLHQIQQEYWPNPGLLWPFGFSCFPDHKFESSCSSNLHNTVRRTPLNRPRTKTFGQHLKIY